MDRVEQFCDMCYRATNLFARKNREYGDAIVATGVMGAMVEVITVAARVQTMLKNPENFTIPDDFSNELWDKMLDLHNYANIVMMMIEDENWTGKGGFFGLEAPHE